MTPIELHRQLTEIVKHQLKRSLMIWGPPGVGKSSIVEQVAQSAHLEIIDLRLSQLAPTDLRGLPIADGKISRWLPPEFLPTTGRGILFLDELNMAPPAVQGIAQQLILNRQVGSYKVPEDWFVWAAGNRKEDRAAVFDMPAPLANRFLHYSVEPHFDSFRSWANGRGVHEQILAFLAFRPSLLHHPDPKNPAWPSCRSWELASELHTLKMPISPAVGEGAHAEFHAFCKIYKKLPDIEKLMNGTGSEVPFPEDPSMRFAVTIALSTRAITAPAIQHGFGWLISRASPEWCQLFIHSIHERAASRNQIGLIATLLTKDPRMKKFLKNIMTSESA
ncbi:MAG: MoxR family ATPase [Verrucomicrobiota bacterium]